MEPNRINSFRELRELVREDWAVNERSIMVPGCLAMLVYRFGVWRLGIRWRLLRGPLSRIYLFLNLIVRNVYGIELYHTTIIGRRFRIGHQGGIVVHRFAVIGDDCVIRQGVTIGQASEKGRGALVPTLGNRVDVGAGAVIIGGISVGDDVVIGPNVVVTTDTPAGSIVVSAPARVLRRRVYNTNTGAGGQV